MKINGLFLVYALLHLQILVGQDTITISDKAFNLHTKLNTFHVLPPRNADTIGLRFNAILLRMIDPEKQIFLQEDVHRLQQLAWGIKDDFSQRKSRYYSEVSYLLQKRISELESIQKGLMEKPLDLKWNAALSAVEQETFPTSEQRSLKWKKNFYVTVYERMWEKNQWKTVFPKDSIPAWEKEAREAAGNRKLAYLLLQKSDNSFLDAYYLIAYALSYDPHSLYLSPDMESRFSEDLSSDVERFGFNYNLNDQNEIIISGLLPGSPAWLSGEIEENDRLIRVGLYEGKTLHFLDVEPGIIGLRKLGVALGNYDGKNMVLVVSDRNGREIQVELTKALIYNDNELVKNALYSGNHKIGYIQLPDFYMDNGESGISRGCSADIAKCILKLKKDGIQGLILDLRGNTGGSLQEAISLTGIFVDYGPVGASMEKDGSFTVYKDMNRGFVYDGPLMVLIDEESASASELVAGALQDYNKALIVGRQSYGKATAQITYPLDPLSPGIGFVYNPDYGYANVTKGILYRVTGESNQVRGVTPDISLGVKADRSKLDIEANETGPIQAPPCTKKMTFNRAYEALPVSELNTFNQLLQQEDWLKRYCTILDSLNALPMVADIPMNFERFVQERGLLESWVSGIEQLRKGLTWNGTLSCNSFDSMLYEQNPVLKGFFDEFLEGTSQDIELKEAMELMEEWLKLKIK